MSKPWRIERNRDSTRVILEETEKEKTGEGLVIKIFEARYRDAPTFGIAVFNGEEIQQVLHWIEPVYGPCWHNRPDWGWHSPYRDEAEKGLEWLKDYYARNPKKLNGAKIE